MTSTPTFDAIQKTPADKALHGLGALVPETLWTHSQEVHNRLNRLSEILEGLGSTIVRGGETLAPILRGGGYDAPPIDTNPVPTADTSALSPIARELRELAQRVDDLADNALLHRRRLEAVLDATDL